MRPSSALLPALDTQLHSWGRGDSGDRLGHPDTITKRTQVGGWIWGLLCDSLSLYPVCRLDYSGIALLIMGSFVPWLYYSFYCSPQPRLIYLSIVCVLGISAIIVAQWDRFATPKHRQTRAGRSSVLAPGGFRGGMWADPGVRWLFPRS